VYHVELRQFPHVARAFNLSAEQLEARIVGPWLAGTAVQWDERRWEPDRARLTIYEAPELRQDQIGLGRGWGNVTKSGEEVTGALLERGRSATEGLKEQVLRRAADGPVTFEEVVAVAGEQAVLELLREGQLQLQRA